MFKKLSCALLVLLLTSCTSVPQAPGPDLRADVLYFENTPEGRAHAEEVTKLFEGRQPVGFTEQKLPEPIYPVLISRAVPLYPYDMRQQNLNGKVTVDFIIGETGEVIDAAVVETTNPGFNSEALRAIRKWTFKPGFRNGKPVRWRLRMSLEFAVNR